MEEKVNKKILALSGSSNIVPEGIIDVLNYTDGFDVWLKNEGIDPTKVKTVRDFNLEKFKADAGGKAAGLMIMRWMKNNDMIKGNVPEGFAIAPAICGVYESIGDIPASTWAKVKIAMKNIEMATGSSFGGEGKPLTVAVRSGARKSMPGMMETILNEGLTLVNLVRYAAEVGDWTAWDSYRRYLEMFAETALGMEEHDFDFQAPIERVKAAEGAATDGDVSLAGWQQISKEYTAAIEKFMGRQFPQDVYDRLKIDVEAVFRSWQGKPAQDYRAEHKIPDDWGTGVNIVAMILGNRGENSFSGVGMSRDNTTGQNRPDGDFVVNAQGEDAVSGKRNTLQFDELERRWPELFRDMSHDWKVLEAFFLDMQDTEYTVEEGKLFWLQTRDAKRSAQAAIRVAVEMHNEGLITKKEALERITAEQVDIALSPQFSKEDLKKAVEITTKTTKSVAAGPGSASGFAAEDSQTAIELKRLKKDAILTRKMTKPADFEGMKSSKGILTQTGGKTCHAAIVANSEGLPTIVGFTGIESFNDDHSMTVVGNNYNLSYIQPITLGHNADDLIPADRKYQMIDVRPDDKNHKEHVKAGATQLAVVFGDELSIDGSSGKVYEGALPVVDADYSELTDLHTHLSWADDIAKMDVWANIDTPEQAAAAIQRGAKGFGLIRIEHMMTGERTEILQQIFEADHYGNTEEYHRIMNDELYPLLRDDFVGIFKAAKGFPVTIRMADPPRGEFLPELHELAAEVAAMRAKAELYDVLSSLDGIDKKVLAALDPIDREVLAEKTALLKFVDELHEDTAAWGLRGVRLAIAMPDFFKMQVRAIIEAAILAEQETGAEAHPKIMIPMVSDVGELRVVKPWVIETANEVMTAYNHRVKFKFGTMLETPRAALTADKIAEEVEFASWGTNDLTSAVWGASRVDLDNFFAMLVEKGIIKEIPYDHLDEDGVVKLMAMGMIEALAVNANIDFGICGEHGVDTKSIMRAHLLGLDYVSGSGKKVPAARLTAAHAELKSQWGSLGRPGQI